MVVTIIYEPHRINSLECYAGIGFVGGWAEADADDVVNIMS